MAGKESFSFNTMINSRTFRFLLQVNIVTSTSLTNAIQGNGSQVRPDIGVSLELTDSFSFSVKTVGKSTEMCVFVRSGVAAEQSQNHGNKIQ